MKRLSSQVTTQPEKNLRGILAAFVAACLTFSVLSKAWGADLFWAGNDVTLPTAADGGLWVTEATAASEDLGTQWSTAPNARASLFWTNNGNVAHFAGSAGGTVQLGEPTIVVDGISFDSGANSYVINTSGFALTIQGTGIVNHSGLTQTIANNVAANPVGTPTHAGVTHFLNTSAGTATITNNGSAVSSGEGGGGGYTGFFGSSTAAGARITNSGSAFLEGSGITQFLNASSAGSAAITNSGGEVSGGITQFVNASTAGTAAITNSGGAVAGGVGGFTDFFDASRAGTATITNNAGGVTGSQGGFTEFADTSAAGGATITNNGGATSGAQGGFTEFAGAVTEGAAGSSSAGSAAITNNGGAANGGGGGSTQFLGASTAANATITNNGSAASGGGGGSTVFSGSSTAGNATITNNGSVAGASGGGGGSTQFSGTSTAGNATIITNGGTGGGGGGVTAFVDRSDGGTARAITNGNGRFDISGLTTAGMGIGSIEGSGNYFLGSKTLTVGGNNLSTTVSGVIQDGGTNGGAGGSLTKVGTGTLTLTGTDTYTGTTTISAGTLQLGNGGPSGSIAGNIIDNGVLAFDRSDIFTFGGLISGAGGVQQNGTGTTVLVGNSTYTGGTTISAGTLQLGAGGTTGSLVGNVTDNGALIFNRSNTVAFGGLISGPGSVTQAGTGTTIFTGDNAYTGGTTISAGTLQLGAGGTTGSIVGNITDNGALVFDHSNTVTFGGVINGTGSVEQIGTGTVVLTGDNTYTGGTSIALGSTLQLGNGGTTGSVVGDIVDNGTLAVDRSATLTLAGVISGTGGLQQNGPGTTILTGDNTYTGTTTVNAGSLIVNGSIASPLTTVNPGGVLGGSGLIRGSVANAGVVSPGDPIDTLTVTGNYTQAPSGTLRLTLAPSGTSLLAVAGVVSLAGAVQLVPTGGFQFRVGERLTLLTAAGGVNGTFATLLNPFVSGTIVMGQLVYLANDVVLEGTQGSFTPIAQTPNQAAIAHALDTAAGDPRAAALIGFLNTEPLGRLPHDLDLISPDELTVVNTLGIALTNVQTANVERRLGDIHAGSTGFSASGFTLNGRTPGLSSAGLAGVSGPEGKAGPSALAPIPQNRWGVFVTGLGEFTNVGSTANAAGFDLRTGGVTLGADYRIGSNFAVGLLGGYAHTDAGLANGGDLEADGGKFGLYATAFGQGLYVDASVIGGYTAYDSRRGALLGQAHGSTDGGDLNVLIAGGYDWKHGGLTVGPTAGFQYTWINVGGFTEHGSLAPLHLDDQHADSYRTSLGAKATYDWKVGGVLLKPELSAAWQHEFGQTQYAVIGGFASGAGTAFGVTGPSVGHDSLLLGAGVSVLWNDRMATYIDYDGELGRANYESNTVTAGVRLTF
jgi:outer membrane autotransporter protein